MPTASFRRYIVRPKCDQSLVGSCEVVAIGSPAGSGSRVDCKISFSPVVKTFVRRAEHGTNCRAPTPGPSRLGAAGLCGDARGGPGLALADRPGRADAGRRRRDPVLARPDGRPRPALRAGRLPLWNDLWGFGFPGLAESQMGVFYPPHWLLYGLLPVEVGLHGEPGPAHALGRRGGGLGGPAVRGVGGGARPWRGSRWRRAGSSLIHLPHQWGYTVGSWMPWAWGLAWAMLRAGRDAARPGLLAGGRAGDPGPAGPLPARVHHPGRRRDPGRLGASSSAVAAAVGGRPGVALAAMVRAGGDAAPADLSPGPAGGVAARLRIPLRVRGDAAPPGQLRGARRCSTARRSGGRWRGTRSTPRPRSISATSASSRCSWPWGRPGGVAGRPGGPGAGGRGGGDAGAEPRAVCAGVLGLIPAARASRSSGPRRGGAWRPRWPLAILAGRGFDAWSAWPRPGRSLVRFAAVAVAAPVVVVLGFELALARRARDRAGRRSPGPSTGPCGPSPGADAPGLAAFVAEARRPQEDLRVQVGPGAVDGDAPRWRRPEPGRREVPRSIGRSWAETAASSPALLALAPLAGPPRVLRGGPGAG